MASYNIFVEISMIASRILMVWKAKLVFGLLNWYDLTTKPNLRNQNYKIFPLGLKQIFQTKTTNWVYKAKFWIVKNQMHQTKSIQSNPKKQMWSNQIYRKLK